MKTDSFKSVGLLSYKGKGNFFNYAIRAWTFSEFSHSELVIDNEYMFSADSRLNLVRLRPYDVSIENWEYLDLTHLVKNFDFSIAQQMQGHKYDYRGILLSQVIPFGIHAKKRWFCSEACYHLLEKWGVLDGSYDANMVSPEILQREAVKALRASENITRS